LSYFGLKRHVIVAPFVAVDMENKFDVMVNVDGGGPSSRASIRHGITCADGLRPFVYPPEPVMLRAMRVPSDTKYGLHKARKNRNTPSAKGSSAGTSINHLGYLYFSR
jgi:ribosomal protein S9